MFTVQELRQRPFNCQFHGAFVGPEWWPPPEDSNNYHSPYKSPIEMLDKKIGHVIYCHSEPLRFSSPSRMDVMRQFAAQCTQKGIPLTRLGLSYSYYGILNHLKVSDHHVLYDMKPNKVDCYMPYFAPEQTGHWVSAIFDFPDLIGEAVPAVGENLRNVDILSVLSAIDGFPVESTRPQREIDDNEQEVFIKMCSLYPQGDKAVDSRARRLRAWTFKEWLGWWNSCERRETSPEEVIQMVDISAAFHVSIIP